MMADFVLSPKPRPSANPAAQATIFCQTQNCFMNYLRHQIYLECSTNFDSVNITNNRNSEILCLKQIFQYSSMFWAFRSLKERFEWFFKRNNRKNTDGCFAKLSLGNFISQICTHQNSYFDWKVVSDNIGNKLNTTIRKLIETLSKNVIRT